MKNNKVEVSIDIIVTLIGTLMLSVGIHSFTAPNHIAPGGVTGIATIINYLFSLPIGGITVLINIPIVILGFWLLGRKFMLKSFISLASFTIFMDYILVNMPVYTENRLVAAIYGGILMGSGMGLMFTRDSSSCGMDIINRIISKRLPYIKLSKIIFASDVVVVAISAVAFRSVEPALYALITLFISSKALDTVLYGFKICKLIYIISDNSEQIASIIMERLGRGVTMLDSYGAYTSKKRPTIMCVISQGEYYKFRKIVMEIDKNAFMIVTSANEIVGYGFESLDGEGKK